VPDDCDPVRRYDAVSSYPREAAVMVPTRNGMMDAGYETTNLNLYDATACWLSGITLRVILMFELVRHSRDCLDISVGGIAAGNPQGERPGVTIKRALVLVIELPAYPCSPAPPWLVAICQCLLSRRRGPAELLA
jgi:hypothetical protein